MFVQLGDVAFNPDKIVTVDFAPELKVHLVDGYSVVVGTQDVAAFLDWWQQCATVIRPKKSRIVIRYSNDGREPRIAQKPPYIEVEFQFERDGAAYHCEICGREAILFTVTKFGDRVPLCEPCADIFKWGQANPRGGVYDIEDYLTDEEKRENSRFEGGDLRRDEEALERLAKEE